MSDTLPHHPTTIADRGHRVETQFAARDVRPFERSSLPHVAAADFGAARRATTRFGKSNRFLTLTLAPFGDLELTFSAPGAAEPPASNDGIFRLRRGHEHGWLVVNGLSGLRVVAAVLGLRSPRIHRGMGVGERGIFAAVVTSIVRASRGTLVATATRGEWSGAGLARLVVTAECELLREHCFLDVPPSWLPAAIAPERTLAATMRQRDLRFRLSLEIARTTIFAEEWSRARPGDAVVFDTPAQMATNSSGRGRTAALVLGEYSAAVALVTDGQVLVDQPFRHREPRPRSVMSQDPTQKINTDVLASAPIEIVAEVGRVVLRADEVLALQPGSILAFAPSAPASVELRVGDRCWATGELVNVDGLLGVRLLAVQAPLPVCAPLGDADTLPR